MNIVCICMSPALDATVTLKAWPKDGDVVKDVEEVENVGGKGVNVARWLALRAAADPGRGVRIACGGLLGADNAVPFEKELAKFGIADLFRRVPGATRRNEMVVTPQGSFKLNRKAFPGLAADAAVLHAEALGVGSGDVVVMSGSLPPCCPASFYADCTRAFRALGATVVLDASGEPLRAAVFSADASARPDVIKPNADECAPLVGFVPKTPADFARATELLRERVPHVVISDGGAGCWFDGVFAPAPEVDVLDTTAAGDTLLAEWCWRTYAAPADEAPRWAVAAGSAACTMPGGEPPALDLVEKLKGSESK
ncbi:MAG: PfkB family carbohydrate kinase [Kiritimatiellae bacterium]|nr:PfkB family carbohydrate kinase [Kiritimatiellia bacterium]